MVANKEELYHKCLETVNKQINKYQNEMDQIKNPWKIMMRIQIMMKTTAKGSYWEIFEKYAGYLDNSRKMKEKISKIDRKHYTEEIDFGSVIETSENYYFISLR